jgi:glycerol-3-phosphate acyltransferase PlsY
VYVIVGLAAAWPLVGAQLPMLCFAAVFPGLLIFKHRGNIARLRAGTEPRYAAKVSSC